MLGLLWNEVTVAAFSMTMLKILASRNRLGEEKIGKIYQDLRREFNQYHDSLQPY